MSKKKKIYLSITFIYLVIYAVWRIFFTLPFRFGVISIILGIMLLICELTGIIESLGNISGVIRDYAPLRPQITPDMYPDIDVLIATHNEPVELLYKTVNGCIHMDYPDKKKVHIYICDDMNRAPMAELAQKMGVGYFTLTENKHAKAGNLNNAIFQTHSPIVVTLDADMIPMSYFLMDNVPYFYLPKMEQTEDGTWIMKQEASDEKIGFIQVPQSFYNADLFQYNLFVENKMPNEQDYFFRKVNVGRNRSNTPIYAGSNTLISREALEEVGGIVTGCITEDMATGIEIQKAGYTCYSVDDVSANGLSPFDVESLIKQRVRWGRGCIDLMRRNHFYIGSKGKGLSWRSKFSYWGSYSYWYSYLAKFLFIVIPVIAAITGIPIMTCALWQVLLIYIPMYILNSRSIRVISGGSRDDKWNNITMMVICPYLIFPMIKENLGFREKKFSVTKKDQNADIKTGNIQLAIPHIIILVLCVIAFFCTLYRIAHGEVIKYAIICFWIVRSMYDSVLSILFMVGRDNMRRDEHLHIEEKIRIFDGKRTLEAVTVDASENGFSIRQELPILIEPGVESDVFIETERYCANMKAILLKAERMRDYWKYSFRICEISDQDKQSYFQILYDRIPHLPQKIKRSMSYSDDLRINLRNRMKEAKAFRREYPRCTVERRCLAEKRFVTVKNFNYEFMLVQMEGEPLEQLTVEPVKGFKIEGILEKQIERPMEENAYLYRILNKDELAGDEKIPQILEELEKEHAHKVYVQRQKRREKAQRTDELNELDLLSGYITFALVFLLVMFPPTDVYAANPVSIQDTYEWNDSMELTSKEKQDGYEIEINNPSDEITGYAEFGLITGSAFQNGAKEFSFEIENGYSDVYMTIGLLSGDGKITWIDANSYLAFVQETDNQLLISENNNFLIPENTKGRIHVSFRFFDVPSQSCYGVVFGLVGLPSKSDIINVSDFKTYYSSEAIVPDFGDITFSGPMTVQIPLRGEMQYSFDFPDGWTIQEQYYENEWAIDANGILRVWQTVPVGSGQIVAHKNGWKMCANISFVTHPNEQFFGAHREEYVSKIDYDPDDAVPSRIVLLIRIVGIVIFLIGAVYYIRVRYNHKRRNR